MRFSDTQQVTVNSEQVTEPAQTLSTIHRSLFTLAATGGSF